MLIVIEGRDLPGRAFAQHANVHVALQVGRDPSGPVPGDAADASWSTEVRHVDGDFRGPAVNGKRGERFLYLTWGSPDVHGWGMFRRAKLMLDTIDPALVALADSSGRPLRAIVTLTDEHGGPRCARVKNAAITWTVDP